MMEQKPKMVEGLPWCDHTCPSYEQFGPHCLTADKPRLCVPFLRDRHAALEAELESARGTINHLEECNRKLYAGRDCPNCGVRVNMHTESDLVLIKQSELEHMRLQVEHAEGCVEVKRGIISSLLDEQRAFREGVVGRLNATEDEVARWKARQADLDKLMQEYTKDCPGPNCKWDDALSVWAYGKGFDAGLHHGRQKTETVRCCRDCKWWVDSEAYGHEEPLKRCRNMKVEMSCCTEPGEDGKDWGSTEYAVFYPDPDFGCVKWESNTAGEDSAAVKKEGA